VSEARNLLAELERLGITVEARQGQLRLEAPRGALTPTVRDAIARHKPEILAILGAQGGRSAALDLSLFFFTSEESTSPEDKYRLVLDGARFADSHGFASVWTPERHFHAMGALFPNPSLLGVAIAGATRRVGIRAGSVVLPLHDPIRVAEEWAVVDNLSRGRAGVSFASGWHANDFVFAPEKYAERKRHMLEAVDVVRRLWRG
jgi:alkanesulfonate monooxygenase SsuD/methylene tetrahydromethanopterin reductase-like flavin-dependent oxidoreductase (luciferase family)